MLNQPTTNEPARTSARDVHKTQTCDDDARRDALLLYLYVGGRADNRRTPEEHGGTIKRNAARTRSFNVTLPHERLLALVAAVADGQMVPKVASHAYVLRLMSAHNQPPRPI
jgi:hypothetical protein